MAVIQKTYIMGDTTDYEYTHPGRYGAPGEKRKEKLIPTPGQVLYQNRKNKATWFCQRCYERHGRFFPQEFC